MTFSYVDWYLSNWYKFIITLPIVFIILYEINKSMKGKVKLIIINIFVIMTSFLLIPSLLFILFSGKYINEYREDFKNYVSMQEKVRYEVEEVRVTNNNGNYIPKFSTKDSNRYVNIEYKVQGKEENKIVNSQPLKSKNDSYALTYVHVDKDFVPNLTRYDKYLLAVRNKLGYKDVENIALEDGAYNIELEVPIQDYERIKSEMNRKSK